MRRRYRQFQAQPTQYAGVTFRSRLESQWARFMDALEWRWSYEPDLQAGFVIPDFLVDFPTRPVVVECKPALTVDEISAERRDLIRRMPSWLADDVLREIRVIGQDPMADPGELAKALSDLDRVSEGDNPTGHTRRVLVVGPHLPTHRERNAATVDGDHGFCLCTGGSRNHVGLALGLGGMCLYCGSAASAWMPDNLVVGAWREAGAAQQWRPKRRSR